MRLWSLHPKYLDSKGLLALWREALLAQKVLWGETKGYRHHPQLRRFLQQEDPKIAIASFLEAVYIESLARNYKFDRSKIRSHSAKLSMFVNQGQLEFEIAHLRGKLAQRAPDRLANLPAKNPETHPLFRAVPGPIEEWEKT